MSDLLMRVSSTPDKYEFLLRLRVKTKTIQRIVAAAAAAYTFFRTG
jgi:hypothetical protein